jgi:hypothetical protein
MSCDRRPSSSILILTVLAGVLSLLAPAAIRRGQAEESVPAAPAAGDAERVFLSGVEGRFDAVREAIAQAKQSSGRTYRVIVVDAAGEGGDARALFERILTRWAAEAETGASDFDPAADVTILLDKNDRLIQMRVPSALEVGSGLDVATIEEELIRKQFVPRAKDGLYDQGLADLVTATETWVKQVQQDEVARIEARRVFRTRTLPLGLAGIAGAGLLGGLLLQWGRHGRRVREAREKLAAFKSEVVALSDLLDDEQERHRMLPHTDPDFQTPMEGMTRATYDNVQGAIRRYRERWLSLMDVWEKAQERIESEWFLGTGAAEDAIRLLDSADARPPLADVAGECRGPLDALEQAHEKARQLVTDVDSTTAATAERLAGVAKRGRSGAPYQAALAEAARNRELAGHDVERDPVAARGRLEEAAAVIDRVGARIDALEAVDDRRQKADAHTDEIEGMVRAKRAEGWLLTEPGANPDDRTAAARQEAALAAQLLDAGDTDAAVVHVERAEKADAEAVALLESIVAAKARAEDLLPECAARLEAVLSRRGQALRAVEQLAASYAESSWSDVADNVAKADEGLGRVRTLIDEARVAMDPSRQHFFRAVALLEEAVRQEDWIDGCQRAIGERQEELDELRAALPPRRDKARLRLNALEQRLHRQRTDRIRANERCRDAGRLLEVAESGMAVARPDLRQVKQLVDAAEDTAVRAEQLADEDDRLARQAADDLEETDAVLRRVAAWYAEGVQPDVRGATSMLETAKSLLSRMQYEDSIKASAESAQAARAAYAAATAEADRRRRRRQQEIQRRQMEESFSRMSRGAGPWVIQLPGGVFTGPDPWRTIGGGGFGQSSGSSRTAGGGWSRDIAQVGW